jgi:hypothetical protein
MSTRDDRIHIVDDRARDASACVHDAAPRALLAREPRRST